MNQRQLFDCMRLIVLIGLAFGCGGGSRAQADPAAANGRGLRYSVKVAEELRNFAPFPNISLPRSAIPINGLLGLTATLHNDGDKPVRVYWGDYALPKMYRFDVQHSSGWKPAITRYWPDEQLPKFGNEKHFVLIAPGQSVSYDLTLGIELGSNGQRCYLNRPGTYIILPTLQIAAREAIDPKTGATRKLPDVWTGELQAKPVTFSVKGDPKLLEEGNAIRGQVVDAAGKGVSKALVIVRHRVSTSSMSSYNGDVQEVELDQQFTSESGDFEFLHLSTEIPSYELDIKHVAHPPRREVVFNRLPAGTKRQIYTAKVTLEAGRSIRGRVRDSQGMPIVDARLTTYRYPEIYTDEDGRFRLTGLPPKMRDIQVGRFGFVSRDLSVPAADDEASRYWVITLKRESEQSVLGKAAFAKGEPLRGVPLNFVVRPLTMPTRSGRQYNHVLSTKTDDQGNFVLVLSESVEFDVLSVAAMGKGEFHLPHRIWQTKLGRIKPQQTDVKLVFDDTHRLVADIRPVRAMPDEFQYKVRCELFEPRQAIEEIQLPHTGGPAVFERLSPGKYLVTVEIEPYRSLPTISRVIEIPAAIDEKTGAKTSDPRAVINFPDLRFGKLIAKVVTADGKPANAARAHYSGRNTSASRNLNPDAQFEVKHLPVGKVTVVASLPGLEGKTEVEIREGKSESIQVVLRPIVPPGVVTGRILYEDGSPALGVSVGTFEKSGLSKDGSYSIAVRKEQPWFVVNLVNVDGWPRFNLADRLKSPFERHGSESLLVRPPIQPGQTISKDIILDRTKLGRLSVNWNRPAEEIHLFVSAIPWQAVPRAAGAGAAGTVAKTEAVLDEQLQFSRSQSTRIAANGKLVFEDLPLGRRVVVAMNYSPYRARMRIAPPGQSEVTFDSKDEGQLRIRVLDQAGRPRPAFDFELQAPLTLIGRTGQSVAFWRSAEAHTGQENDSRAPVNPYLQSDGWMQISQLDAGRYELTVTDGGKSKAITVEVKGRELTSREVRLDD